MHIDAIHPGKFVEYKTWQGETKYALIESITVRSNSAEYNVKRGLHHFTIPVGYKNIREVDRTETDLNIWGTVKTTVDPDYCPECEKDYGHYDSCPVKVR